MPALFLVKRPKVGWGNLAAYGALIGCGQFGLLFIALRDSISPGIASLMMQTQVIFTSASPRSSAASGLPGAICRAGAVGRGIAVIMIYTDGSITHRAWR